MKYCIHVLCICLSLTAVGQQDPLYAQYVFNPFILNPAYAGFSKDFNAMASYRLQWAGVDGAPVTMSATGHVALAGNRMGLGAILLQDKIGSDKTTQFIGSYGYHVLLGNNRKVSFGLRGGVINYRLDYSSLRIDSSDPQFQDNISEIHPVVGAGFIYSSDHLFLSLSVPNLMKTSTSNNGVQAILYNQHAYAQVAYLWQATPRLKVKPFMLARAVQNAPINLDVGAMLSADDSYTVGVFTRRLHTYGVLAKLNIGELLRLGYIFELPTSNSIGINHATHEFTVGIRMAVIRSHDIDAISDF